MTVSEIKARMVAIVSASPLLTERPVLIEDKGNLVAQVEQVLQTQSLAIVVALSSGAAKDPQLRARALWDEVFEIVIHRGLLDGDEVPASDAVLVDLRERIGGSLMDPAKPTAGKFYCIRHDLRDGGDGTYARVLTVGMTQPI